MDRLESETELDIPDAMLEDRATELFHAQVEQISRQFGIGEEQYLQAIGKTHEDATAEYREQAERDVRRTLILRALVERENLQLDDADVDAEREQLLGEFDAARREEMAKLLDSPQMRQSLRSSALDRKLNDRLVELATGQAQAATTADPALPTAIDVEDTETASVATDDETVVQTAVEDSAVAPNEIDQAPQNG
jgi:trigger factor